MSEPIIMSLAGASVKSQEAYTDAILSQLKIAIINGLPLKVIIGRGKKSHQVYSKVLSASQGLKSFANLVGGDANRVRVTIEMR